MRKSQSALEFVILTSFMLLAILGFFAITSSKVLESREESDRKVAEDIAKLAYREIEIAKSVNDGYVRVFSMPETINGVDYTISIIDNREIVVNYLNQEYIEFMPSNVTGSISKGTNVLTKNEGSIIIGTDLSTVISLLKMKNTDENIIRFDDSGNVVLKKSLQQNVYNPPTTGNDEFIFKGISGNNLVVLNLNNGDMKIAGTLFQNQGSLNPAGGNNFIVRNSTAKIISYFDGSGNWYMTGTLTQNGNP